MYRRIVTWGSWLTAAGLILLGLHVFLPNLAAWGYGVEPVDENGTAYLIAAGARDLSLGCMILFLLKFYRSALAGFFVCLLVVPIADTLIVLKYGTATWKILPHAVGIVAIGMLAFCAAKESQPPK